ncbi:MAG TPA: response regulator transcription factor [Candidatus Paceibacterota bacterium]|nr:response regulator transcription factor [Candidatus Paceibacterota bacterium]
MLKVIIADDHTVVRHGLKEILTHEFGKIKIAEARDAREATELLAKEKWDLILLDINMPGRSGLDVLSDARLLCPGAVVLMLSAYPEKEFAVRAFKLGASGYLNKQGAFDELITAVKRVLTGGKYVTASLAELLASGLGSAQKQDPHDALSNRELQVLRMIASGKALKEIAAELSLSEKTVGTYRMRIAEKMHLATNVELTRYALQHQLVE